MARTTLWEDEYTLLCERCGYVIEGLPTEGDCPECGKPIAESLPERRVGTPWQQEPASKVHIATGIRTLLAPRRTLGIVMIDEGLAQRMRRRYLWLAALLTAPLLSVLALLLLERPDPLPGGGEVVWSPGSVEGARGLVAALCLFTAPVAYIFYGVLTWLETEGLRFFGSRRGFRISQAVSQTICAHGAAAWLISGVGALVTAWALLPMEVEHGSQPPRLGWLVAGGTVSIIGLLVFEGFAYLGMRRCKFANRARTDTHARR